MKILTLLHQMWARGARHARTFTRAAASARTQRRRQQELAASEAERLDRIRHPSKYLGKP